MSISIPYVTPAWRWLGQQLQADAAYFTQEQHALDIAARQSDSFLATAGLKTLAGLHGLGTWIVKTPGALAYGSVDFVATVLTDTSAALRAIPETIQHSGNEIYAGGVLLAHGTFSEGLTRLLDGITGDTMIILGGRGVVRGAVKAAPEAGRLAQSGYRMYADAVTTGLESLQSMGPPTPNTPMNVWMRHPRRGAVAIQPSASPIPALIREASTAPWVREGVLRSCEPYEQLLGRIRHNPGEIAPYIEQIVEGIAVDDRMARPYDWLVRKHPKVAQPHHLPALLRRGGDTWSAVAIAHLAQAHPQFFETAHIPTMIDFAQQARGQTYMLTAMNHLVSARPELFTAAHLPGLLESARTTYVYDHPLISLMTRRADLFTPQHVSDIIQVAETHRTMGKKHPHGILLEALRPLSPLVTEHHVAAIANIAKSNNGFAYFLKLLVDIRPDLKPAIIKGLLEATPLNDGAMTYLVELVRMNDTVGRQVYAALAPYAQTVPHVAQALQKELWQFEPGAKFSGKE